MDNQGSNNNYNNGNSNGGNNGDGGKGNHNGQILMAFILISLIALFIMSLVTNQFNQMSTQEVSYSEFLDMVNGTGKWEGRSVKSVEIGSYQIDITLNSDEKTPYEVTYYCGRVADEHIHLDLQYFKLPDSAGADLGCARRGDAPDGRRRHGCRQEQCQGLCGEADRRDVQGCCGTG